LEKQIKELKYEIQDATRELVDDLLGTNVGGFAENLVSNMIDAFKKGEDYMQVFSDSFDDMIDNMIMKSIVGRVVSNYLDSIWDSVEERIAGRTKKEADAYVDAQAWRDKVNTMSDANVAWQIALENGMNPIRDITKITQQMIDDYRKAADDAATAAKKEYDAVSQIGDSDIDYVMEKLAETTPELGEKLKEILGKYYKFGEDSDKQLSALQQGIQGVTEDTAGAIEAYMNIVAQRVFEQNIYLQEICDHLNNFDLDVQLGTLSQMLLQLQQSYQVQQNIESILTGVLNPSGRAIVVELNS
jgi:hypothetical protein